MPDVWANVAELDEATQERLAGVLESRGADPRQRTLRDDFLAAIPFPDGARVVDVGCGTGVLTRRLAELPGVASVVGVDVALALLARARELAASPGVISFVEGDGRALPFGESRFDVVVLDSTLSHVPGPEDALAEAFRVLEPGGTLAVFDGDYGTTTVALGHHDPLQACVDEMVASSVTDRWVMRRLPALARECGFELLGFRSHGFVDVDGDEYMLSIVDRGADLLVSSGRLGAAAADALKQEARQRARQGAFFGHIAYASLVARRPG